MKKIVTVLVACILSATVLGQAARLQKADSYFEKFAYSYAAEQYERVLGTDSDSPEVQAKLAFCYLQMKNNEKAVQFYEGMIQSALAKPDDFYNYSYALKQIGNYGESDVWMNKFAEVAPTDSRAQLYLNNKNYKSRIDHIEPYFSIENLEMNTKSKDFGGYYSVDESKMYFISSRAEPIIAREYAWDGDRFLDIFSANLDADNKASNIKQVKKVNIKFHEGPLAFSPDGGTVYFTRNNTSTGSEKTDDNKIQKLKLYIADVDGEGNWVNEREFPYNSREYSVGHPSVSTDGSTLYFSSDMPGGYGGADIYKVEIIGAGFGEIFNMGPHINTEGQEMFPYISGDNKLFFSSDGLIGLGGLDVYVSFLDSKGEGTIAQNLGKPINSKRDDFAFVLNKSQSTGFVSSNRDGGIGDDDIYSTVSLRPIERPIMIEGVTMKTDSTIIAGVTVELLDEEGDLIESVLSSKDGEYTFLANRSREYKLKGSKEGFEPGTNTASTFTEDDVVKADLILMTSDEYADTKIKVGDDLGAVIKINPIYFDLDKYYIRPDAALELDKIVDVMNSYPSMVIELGSHTDCRATAAYNMRLSDNRAKASADYIKRRISNPDRIYGKGYGESRLVNHCACEPTNNSPCSEAEHQMNRRTEFRVIRLDEDVKVINTSPDSF